MQALFGLKVLSLFPKVMLVFAARKTSLKRCQALRLYTVFRRSRLGKAPEEGYNLVAGAVILRANAVSLVPEEICGS